MSWALVSLVNSNGVSLSNTGEGLLFFFAARKAAGEYEKAPPGMR
jgi:hypothetical protein